MSHKLLNTNAKLLKWNGGNYLVAGLTLAPHTLSGHMDVCPHATPGCKAACVLWFTGRTVMPKTRIAMKRRTELLANDPVNFLELLHQDLARHERRARKLGTRAAVRLNVASDLDWSDVARAFPETTFYDYTKVYSRILRTDWPNNYFLTYSWSERSCPTKANRLLELGRNVSVVFDTPYNAQRKVYGKLPDAHILGDDDGLTAWPVVDGDRHDLRLPEFDGRGNIVGLRFKGSAKRKAQAIRAGFCVPA